MDQITQLRQLIQESIQEYIREVEASGNMAAQEAKIRACDEAITLREKKINLEGLDETMHEMIDQTKLNELKKEVKALESYKKKAEKILEKMKSKAEGKTTKKDSEETETTDEGIIDEVNLDEYTADPNAGPELEEGKMSKKEKEKKEDIVKSMKKSKSFGKSKEEKAKMYATATKLATKESVNEQFLHMQKLAGLITETEYKEKVNELFGLFKKTAYEKLKASDDISVEEVRTMYTSNGEKDDKSYGDERFGSYKKMISSVPNKYNSTYMIITWKDSKGGVFSVKVDTSNISEGSIQTAVENKYGKNKS